MTEPDRPGTPQTVRESPVLDGAAAHARRGVLSITASKLVFILAGYGVQLSLPRLLGSPEAFGLYSSLMSMVSILNNVLVVATIQTVSKQVSATATEQPATLRQALTVQLCLGGLLALSLYGSAPLLAHGVLRDALLAPLLRIAAVVVFCYALYAALVGYLNGRQLFQRQAALDLTYTTLRTAGILGAAALGFGVQGAVAGFALAATLVLAAASVTVGLGRRGNGLPYRSWLGFMAPVLFYHLCLNLILQVDLSMLKRNVATLALSAGGTAAAAAQIASRYAGFYRSAQTFSFVPYQLILSVAFVVFPMIAHATALGDARTTRSYIRNALRFSLLVLCAIAAPVSGASSGVLRIAYSDEYLTAADALSVLSIGMAAFALFVVTATILTGAGMPRTAALIACTAVGCVVACNALFVFRTGLSDDVLQAAACGTSVGTALALTGSALVVYWRFGTFLDPKRAARILAAAGVGFYVARTVPHDSELGALAALLAGGLAYLSALVLMREIGLQDLRAMQAAVLRK